ncbi:MAG TPA: flippase-like domain-containing protein [Phycisphaerae bacterium]|nr:flippase-like domain-containing protein [Phycisphaerae bacterium]
MKKETTKRLLISIKVVLAVVLLAWVLSQAHWKDYLLAKPEYGGKAWTYLPKSEDGEQYVERGILWWKERKVFTPNQYLPVPEGSDQLVRRGFVGTLKNIHVPLLVLAAMGFPIALLVVAWRLRYLLNVQKVTVSFWESVRLTFLGQFFNQVVPGTVGGDLVKAWYLSKHTPHTGAVLVTVFVDRLMGLIELVLMATVMLTVVLVCGLAMMDQMRTAIITVTIVTVIVVFVMAFLLSSRLRGILHLQKIYQRLPIAHHIQAAGEATHVYRRRPGVLLVGVLITIVAHVFFIGSIAILGFALRLPTSWYDYFIYLPLIYIIGAIPITPGGVGWVEKLYVSFFVVGAAAVGTTGIIALAMLSRILQMFWGLPGLLVAVTGPKLPKAKVIEAELEEAERHTPTE